MPGYTGYHRNKRNGWSTTTIAAVLAVHGVLAVGAYRIAQTDYFQHLIKVSKLVTVPEPVKPKDPPPQDKDEPAPESPPEIPPESPPMVKDLPPEPAPLEPADEPSPALPSAGEDADSAPVDAGPMVIGKGRGRFAGYEDALMASIHAVYQQPPELPDALEYAVLCQLVLDEEGHVLTYQLLNSSGSPLFDRSAQLALSRLRQVRPPPPGMSRTVVVKFYPP
ncbi:energy transducer TonB family protein [Nitrospira lenta]|uniref:TonB C-terminal domain-containing protein n=1 Tax=Nitrospira lenta TaxID=1436998 RepID=A0A330L172_9BACT|nr:energy transducer TonB [Nitrospira lenta]SPP62963.1 exported hypothetical protein [Nitrospira lenta]